MGHRSHGPVKNPDLGYQQKCKGFNHRVIIIVLNALNKQDTD